ncbi:hypothetical protein OBBRIDRAFT_833609 [Obba rivulosa]|uniref:DUF6532 domain-containing protein n=1 Tax=Obba rivulosa TaxID=1052685 RepID=A0A8E2AX19_9APHY|nr:hypothetical protein OBBRIDRAFT_833609 [Obba rivulosa]
METAISIRIAASSDLPPDCKAILNIAYEHLRILLITCKPWAKGRALDDLAMQAWENACDELGLVGEQRLQPGLDERTRMVERGSLTQGTLKTKIQKEIFASHYGFVAGATLKGEEKAANRALVKLLKDRDAFVHLDPRKRGSLFQNGIVAKALYAVYFMDTQAPAVRLTTLYFSDGIPVETLALVFTAVQNCIDEYAEGVFHQIDFTEKKYKREYNRMLGQLQRWDSYSREKTDKAGQIRRELLGTCRAAAGVANEEEPYEEAGGGISDSELKAFEDTE